MHENNSSDGLTLLTTEILRQFTVNKGLTVWVLVISIKWGDNLEFQILSLKKGLLDIKFIFALQIKITFFFSEGWTAFVLNPASKSTYGTLIVLEI